MEDKDLQNGFKQRVKKLIDMTAQKLWKLFQDGILRACDEVCGRKIIHRGDI